MTDHALAAQPEGFDLREHHDTPAIVPVPPVRMLRPRAEHKLYLPDYVSTEATPPPAVHRSHLEFTWGMLLNDTLGDCGEAMAIHGNEAFHLDAGTPVPAWGDPDAELAYEEVGDYVPGDPSTDQGTDNHVLVQKWQSPGLLCAADGKRHTIVASAFVPPGDQRLEFLAIWEFVVLFRAVGLPVTAQGRPEWTVVDPALRGDASVGSWGYHDVPELSYDGRLRRLISWSKPMLETEPFDKAYAVEGFVVITEEQTNNRGVSPAGINWTRLNADIAKL